VTKLYANPQLYAGDFDNAEFADRIATLPLAISLQRVGNYGHSTEVLGRVVEVASGADAVSIRKAETFDPSACPRTAYYVAGSSEVATHRQVIPVDRSRVAGIKDPGIAAALGIRGRGPGLDDRRLRRFLQMLLNGGKLTASGTQGRDGRADASDQIGRRPGSFTTPLFSGPGRRLRFLALRAHLAANRNTTWHISLPSPPLRVSGFFLGGGGDGSGCNWGGGVCRVGGRGGGGGEGGVVGNGFFL